MRTPREVAQNWLSEFSKAVGRKEVDALGSLFLSDGWLRDSLVLSWDVHSLEGRDRIKEYLALRLPQALIDPDSFHLDERPGLSPALFSLSADVSGMEAAFVFQTPKLLGRGFVRLQLDTSLTVPEDRKEIDGLSQSWRALSLYIAAGDIKGYEEAGPELGLYDGHTLAWAEVLDARRKEIESDPVVLIIGAGQTGLQVAARFKQLNIRTIVIERNERIGDNWRKRYPTLSLNTPRSHHTLLYAPYPQTWPIFTPRDKIASWLEYYADSQDLIVWTSTFPIGKPEYNYSTRRWRVSLSKNGLLITVRPKHVVLATGTLGDPFIPPIPSLSYFHGETLHASEYRGGQVYSGKRILIVGSGTTAADLAQDLHTQGAASIMMLQRHPTCVVSRKLADTEFQAWPDGVPLDASDFKVAATPVGLALRIARSQTERARRAKIDGSLRTRLKLAGFKTTDGPNGGGRRELVYERLGGYWIDVGAAELIIKRFVKVKSRVGISRFDKNGTTVHFPDASTMDLDVVIFATGYENIRQSMESVFGKETMEQTSEVWGLDEEGEPRGCYRPSGHPGLWYAAGDFFFSRHMSKQLVSELSILTFLARLGSRDSTGTANQSRRTWFHYLRKFRVDSSRCYFTSLGTTN